MMKHADDIIRPIFKRLRAAEIEDAAGDHVIANRQFIFIAIECTVRVIDVCFSRDFDRAFQNIKTMIRGMNAFLGKIICQRTGTAAII